MDEQHLGCVLFLEPLNDVGTVVDADASVDDLTRYAVLGQVLLQQFYGVRERDKHQHLVARLLNDFLYHIQPIAYVELNDFALVGVHRTARYLQQLVNLYRSIDRAHFFPVGLNQHLLA